MILVLVISKCPFLWRQKDKTNFPFRMLKSFANKIYKTYTQIRPIPKDLISRAVYKFQCGLLNESYYGKSIRHLDIRSEEHLGVPTLTGKKVKPVSNSAACDHLLHFNYLPSFDNFSILAHENKKFLLGIKESLLITKDKPSLSRKTSSAPLHLFDKVS